MSGVGKKPATSVPRGKPSVALELLPKALLADIAWNFAQLVVGEEDETKQLEAILEEATMCRPEKNWRGSVEAAWRRHQEYTAAHGRYLAARAGERTGEP